MSAPEERGVRLEKLEKLREEGINPFPTRSVVDHDISEVFAKFDELAENETEVNIAGRLIAFRSHGGSSFAHIQDRTGKIQLYFKKNIVGADKYKLLKLVDIGDFINLKGTLFKTRTEEQTLLVLDMTILSKSILPLPEKWHGISDEELKVRYRYLDSIMDSDARDRFRTRSKIISKVRNFLDMKDYTEVETPVLQPLYGGASARPFKTHHNAMDMTLFLRIADELYLKRLIIGGFDRVYEIGKIFRNEGVDRFHNPEFTMLELYQAYGDYNTMMNIAETLIAELAEMLGMQEVTYQENTTKISAPFERISFYDSIEKYSGIDVRGKSEEELWDLLKENGVSESKKANLGQLLDAAFSHFVEPNLISPTFVTDHPVEISPLAKRKPDNPELTERFELFWFGMELANAFTELNDPIDQRERFEKQMSLKAKGDPEAQVLDEDFLEAMEHGMPPTGGMGIGIDRLAMIFTNSYSLREILLFPHVKPRTDN